MQPPKAVGTHGGPGELQCLGHTPSPCTGLAGVGGACWEGGGAIFQSPRGLGQGARGQRSRLLWGAAGNGLGTISPESEGPSTPAAEGGVGSLKGSSGPRQPPASHPGPQASPKPGCESARPRPALSGRSASLTQGPCRLPLAHSVVSKSLSVSGSHPHSTPGHLVPADASSAQGSHYSVITIKTEQNRG